MTISRPFLKWAGNKYRLVKSLKAVLPPGERLIEPFLGSGAIFLNLDYKKYLLGEMNPDLINLFKIIKKEGKEFIDYLQTFIIPGNNSREIYMKYRKLFNETNDVRLKSALFIYLNRHSYNGLCRYNKCWEFNVPFGSHDSIYFPEKQLHYFHKRSKKARFVCQDFRKTLKMAKPGDVVYCDPPYIPISDTSNFTSYASGGFNEQDQIDLANLSRELAKSKIPVIISNHDNAFARKIYKGAEIHSFEVSRTISQDTQNRKPVKELFAIFR